MAIVMDNRANNPYLNNPPSKRDIPNLSSPAVTAWMIRKIIHATSRVRVTVFILASRLKTDISWKNRVKKLTPFSYADGQEGN